jgi:hypothetical protein
MFCLPIVLFQKLPELCRRKRRTDEKSPDRVAPGLVEHLSLIFCFDALRDHVKTERLAQRDNRSYQQPRPPTRINVQIVHERAVDPDRIDGVLTDANSNDFTRLLVLMRLSGPSVASGAATVKGSRRAGRSRLRSRKISQTTARQRHCFVHCPSR